MGLGDVDTELGIGNEVVVGAENFKLLLALVGIKGAKEVSNHQGLGGGGEGWTGSRQFPCHNI